MEPINAAGWAALKAVAIEVRERAYVPYSNYRVGAALLMLDGTIVAGCNVENATFGATCCAERNAVFAAVAKGYREFRAVVVVTDGALPGTPCGICRQVLAEFGFDLPVLCFTPGGSEQLYRLSELLPHAFRLK